VARSAVFATKIGPFTIPRLEKLQLEDDPLPLLTGPE
jgi:hypothetical protein